MSAIKVPIIIDAPLDAIRGYGNGALIRVERSGAVDGTYSEIGTIAVGPERFAYEHWDATGTATSWYRWAISDATKTKQSGYSAPIPGVDAIASSRAARCYGTLDSLLLRFDQPPTGSAKLARLEQLLVDATQALTEELGFDFFAHPLTGDGTWYLDSSGTDELCAHDGIVSLATVEVRTSPSDPYVTVASTDYELEHDANTSAEGEPFDHVVLTGAGALRRWPRGHRSVRLTGVRGWASVPATASSSVVARARQLAASDPMFGGGPVGPDEYGRPIGPTRMPDEMWRFMRVYRSRFYCHV